MRYLNYISMPNASKLILFCFSGKINSHVWRMLKTISVVVWVEDVQTIPRNISGAQALTRPLIDL